MITLTVTECGKVTLPKGVLQHLGAKPGERIELDLLLDGRAKLKAAEQTEAFYDLAGFLKGKTNGNVLSVDGIDKAIAGTGAAAGAGKR